MTIITRCKPPLRFYVNEIDSGILEWYGTTDGGYIGSSSNGNAVSFNKGKSSRYWRDGSGRYEIRFDECDSDAVMLFALTFSEKFCI